MREGPLSEQARRAERTYGAASDHYTLGPLGFWDRFGAATVSRLQPAAGDEVLDLCCGAGASAIPSARAVGAAGRVVGVDIAEPMLELARARAAREGLANIEFRRGDATSTGLPGSSFDAVVCVFGVFFVPDMTAFIAEMWRLVRPGGVLAITTWGPGFLEPASSLFWESVREVEPSLYRAFNPWDEITTPEALLDLHSRAGVPGATAVAVPGEHHLEHPDSFWDVVLGTGYRATVDSLGPDQRDRVRTRLVRELRSRDVTVVCVDVVFGTARRPERLPPRFHGWAIREAGAGGRDSPSSPPLSRPPAPSRHRARPCCPGHLITARSVPQRGRATSRLGRTLPQNTPNRGGSHPRNGGRPP